MIYVCDYENEEWRPVVGWEGLYEVSSLGRVRSLERNTVRYGKNVHLEGKIMNLCPDGNGYIKVNLFDNGRTEQRLLGRMVAEAFLVRPDGVQRIRYKNGNPSDCRVENIKWARKKSDRHLEKRDKVDLPGEVWRDIHGYESLYQISNMGRVYSKPRPSSRVGILRQVSGLNGYLNVTLCKNGKSTQCPIHRLVAEHFVENPHPDEWDCVNHRDEDKHNNVSTNLEWCTTSYNASYGTATERRIASRLRNAADPNYKPVKHNPLSVKPNTKAVIQSDLNGNVIKVWNSIKEVVETLGYDRSCISAACNRRRRYESGMAHGYLWQFETEAVNETS